MCSTKVRELSHSTILILIFMRNIFVVGQLEESQGGGFIYASRFDLSVQFHEKKARYERKGASNIRIKRDFRNKNDGNSQKQPHERSN